MLSFKLEEKEKKDSCHALSVHETPFKKCLQAEQT